MTWHHDHGWFRRRDGRGDCGGYGRRRSYERGTSELCCPSFTGHRSSCPHVVWKHAEHIDAERHCDIWRSVVTFAYEHHRDLPRQLAQHR